MIHARDPLVVETPESLRISSLEDAGYLKTIYDDMSMRKHGLDDLMSRHRRLIDRNKIWFSEPDEVPGCRVIRIIRHAPGYAHVDGVRSDGVFFQYRCVDRGDLCFQDLCLSILSGSAHIVPSEDMSSLSPYSSWFLALEKSLFWSRVALKTDQDDPDDWSARYARFYKTGFFAKLRGVTKARIARAMRASNKRLIEALDAEVLRALHRTGRMRMRDAEWLSGADGEHSVTQCRETRCQAAMVYPTLMSKLCAPTIDHAITSRQELSPVLAAELGIRTATIRRLSGVSWQMAAMRPTMPDLSMFRDLADHHFPSGRKGFANLASATRFLRVLTGLGGTGIADARGISPERILDLLSRQSSDMVQDYLHHLHDTLVAPLNFRRMVKLGDVRSDHAPDGTALRVSRALWADHALKSFGLKALVEGSQAWHRAPRNNTHKHIQPRAWRPLFGSYSGQDNIILREITSAPEMHAIGRHQQHCVGGYAGRVTSWTGRVPATLIVCLEQNGVFASTAEMSVSAKDDTLKVTIIQNRAAANKLAPPWTTEMLLRLCQTPENFGISASALSRYAADLALWRRRAEEDARFCPTVSVFGFCALKDDEMLQAWEKISRFLPQAMRKSGYENLANSLPDGIFPCVEGHRAVEDMLLENTPF